MAKIKEPDARAAYLAMGPSRTTQAVYEHFTKRCPKDAPCVDSVRLWCTKHGWVALAAEYDATVQAGVKVKAEAAGVKSTFDAVEALTRAAALVLDAATLEIAAQAAAIKGDARGMINAAIEALKLREVLTGGVSDRTARVDDGLADRLREIDVIVRGVGRSSRPSDDDNEAGLGRPAGTSTH